MIRNILTAFFGKADPADLKLMIAFCFLALIISILWLMKKSGESSSQFRVFEADRDHKLRFSRARSGLSPHEDLAQAKLGRASAVLQLEGIRIDGAPHEVLGVPAEASSEQIQKAYRDLMKRFHPDKVGTAGSPQWHEAQKVAEALNHAKEELLKKKC